MPQTRLAFLGASGRIGRLLRAAERCSGPETKPDIAWQFRDTLPGGTSGFLWPDFDDPQPFLSAHEKRGFAAMLVFSGAGRTAAKDDPGAMRSNVTLVDRALTAAVRAGISRVLVASSSAVYGAGQGRAFREGDALAPLNAYGIAKAEMEALCARRAAQQGIEICALRIGNVAGADMLLGNAMAAMARGAGEPPLHLDVFPDGAGPRRSYIGPQRLLRVLKDLSCLRGVLPPQINLAGTVPVEMNALLDAAGVPWQGRPCALSGHQNITLDCARLAALCPGVDLAQEAGEIIADRNACVEQR